MAQHLPGMQPTQGPMTCVLLQPLQSNEAHDQKYRSGLKLSVSTWL